MTRLALGIDAGGSRTRCVVVDESGELLGTGDGPGANPNSTPDIEAAFATALGAATAGLPRRTTLRVTVAVVAVAGAGPAGRPRIEAAVRAAATTTEVLFDDLIVCSDCEAAFAAGSSEGDGTVLIAGTGAIAAQLVDFRVVRRRDGHGYLLGDAGSAFWVGAAAVRAVLADIEGDGPATALRAAVLDRCRNDPAVQARVDAAALDEVQTVLAAAYAYPPARLAALAPLVDAAAEQGDPEARRIVDAAVRALVHSVEVVRPSAPVDAPLVVTGGVATGSGPLATSLRTDLESRFAVSPRIVADGRLGAAALALRHLPGADPEAAARLVSTERRRHTS